MTEEEYERLMDKFVDLCAVYLYPGRMLGKARKMEMFQLAMFLKESRHGEATKDETAAVQTTFLEDSTAGSPEK